MQYSSSGSRYIKPEADFVVFSQSCWFYTYVVVYTLNLVVLLTGQKQSILGDNNVTDYRVNLTLACSVV